MYGEGNKKKKVVPPIGFEPAEFCSNTYDKSVIVVSLKWIRGTFTLSAGCLSYTIDIKHLRTRLYNIMLKKKTTILIVGLCASIFETPRPIRSHLEFDLRYMHSLVESPHLYYAHCVAYLCVKQIHVNQGVGVSLNTFWRTLVESKKKKLNEKILLNVTISRKKIAVL